MARQSTPASVRASRSSNDEPPRDAGLEGVLVLARRRMRRELQREPDDTMPRVRAVGGAQRPASTAGWVAMR